MKNWRNYKRGYIQRHHPLKCAVCSFHSKLELHHILPQATHPHLAQEDSNIIVLCRLHHFIVGHNSNWFTSNPNVVADAEKIRLSRYNFEKLNSVPIDSFIK